MSKINVYDKIVMKKRKKRKNMEIEKKLYINLINLYLSEDFGMEFTTNC